MSTGPAILLGRHPRRPGMKIVVIGGSGLIGKKLIPLLRGASHEAVSASPSSGVNTLTGEGLSGALAGADVVVDVTNSPSFEDKAVLEFFETSRCLTSVRAGRRSTRRSRSSRVSPRTDRAALT
jgi:hypothetical protein